MRSLRSLNNKEIVAGEVAGEEEEGLISAAEAVGCRKVFPATAALFEGMREEESGHRRRLIDLYRTKFGEHIPLIRRHDVRGFVTRRPVWLMKPLRLDAVRKQAETLEVETRRFYEKALDRMPDASIRQLLTALAQDERGHEDRAGEVDRCKLDATTRAQEDDADRRIFVLQIVQPGLDGLSGV